MTDERKCKKCGRWLTADMFWPDQVNQQGYTYHVRVCKQCDQLRRAFQRQKARSTPAPDGTRVCRTCGVEKPLTEYYLSSRGGRVRTCKVCRLAKDRAYYAERAADPEWRRQKLDRAKANHLKRAVRRMQTVRTNHD